MSKKEQYISAIMSRMSIEDMVAQLITTGAHEGQATGLTKNSEAAKFGFVLGPKSLDTTIAFQDAAMVRDGVQIPLAFVEDVIHGYKTGQPLNLGQAGLFNGDFVSAMARDAAEEASSVGIDITFSPVADLSHHRQGRISETLGEPTILRSDMVRAMVKGYQGTNLDNPTSIAAIGKHFIGYQDEDALLDYKGAEITPSAYNTEHRPPFEAMGAAGAAGLMVSFNTVNGIPMHANKDLIEDICQGHQVVFADFTGIEELEHHGLGGPEACTVRGLMSGVDVDLISNNFMKFLPTLAQTGYTYEDAGLDYTAEEIQARIKEACQRVLGLKYDLGLFVDPYLRMKRNQDARVMTPEQVALARKAAAEVCILFKNNEDKNGQKPLPLQINKKIAVIGPLAFGDEARANMPGTWSVNVDKKQCITPLEGLEEVLGDSCTFITAKGANITNDPNEAARLNVHSPDYPCVIIDGCDPDELKCDKTPEEKAALSIKIDNKLIKEAVKAARKSNVILAFVGEASEHSGESSCRLDTGLPGSQLALLKALKKVADEKNIPLVVTTFSGRPLVIPWIKENADAHVHAWFGGTQAGTGLADMLAGGVNPYAKTPVTWQKHSGLNVKYNDLSGGRPHSHHNPAVSGDRELDEDGHPSFSKFRTGALDVPTPHKPLYYLGEGKSYTSFVHSAPSVNYSNLRGEDDVLEITTSITNTGDRDGKETVMLFMHDPVSSRSQPGIFEENGRKEGTLIRYQQIDIKGNGRNDAGKIIQPGEVKEVTFRINVKDLEFSIAKELLDKRKIWEPGEFIFMTGPSANPKDLKAVSVDWRKSPKNKHTTTVSAGRAPPKKLTDDELLDKVQKSSIRYVTEKCHAPTGMPFERTDPNAYGGIALIATGGAGFAIQSILVGVEKGWVKKEDALEQIGRMVTFLERAPKFHGAFAHYYEAETEKVFQLFDKDNGGDIVETSLLMTGLLCARQYFTDNDEESAQLRSRINTLWENVEWDWYTNQEDVLFWHWSEDHDFATNHRITGYNECMGTYVMAASSPTHPIAPDVYRNGWAKDGKEFKSAAGQSGPLFFEFFNFMGLDPKGLEDRYAAYATYEERAREHVLADRAHCIKNPHNFPEYGSQLFGLSECDTPDGYQACSPENDNGTITPHALFACIQFAPEACMAAIRNIWGNWGDKIMDEYGPFESFNLSKNWFSTDRVAVHHGTIAPGIERARSTFIQDLFMGCDEIKQGLTRLGFKSPHISLDYKPSATVPRQRNIDI